MMVSDTKPALLISGLISAIFSGHLIVAFGHLKGQSDSGIAQTRIQRYKVEKAAIADALEKLANNSRIPIGLVLSGIGGKRNEHLLTVDETDTTVADILNQIIQQSTEYRWLQTDGVINVFPVSNANNFISEVLETRLDDFIVKAGTPRFQVRKKLLEHPDVLKKAKKYKMTALIAQFGCGFQSCYIGGDPNYSTTLRGKTVKQILNHLILRSGMFFWKAYTAKDTYSIMF